MHSAFAGAGKSGGAIPLHLVTVSGLADWLGKQDKRVKAVAASAGFKADAGKVLLVSDAGGSLERVVAGAGDGSDGFVLASLPGALPAGDYALADHPEALSVETLALGWADGAYRFTKYRRNEDKPRRLVMPEGADRGEVVRQAEAIDLLRDLVNTPAADMGPAEIAAAAETIAREFDARIEVTRGKDLEAQYPMVHAVGKGATVGGRFIEMSWGKSGPVVVIVGKGVAFDTGGLNLKTSGMGLMKKDMGGAAHALALARLVMGAKLPVQLKVLVPTVENAIGPAAFRPSDVLTSRKGLTVEIEDTDAEGRLILADALTRASELKPALIIDFATLTGAARVALGPDLAPMYTDDDQLAADISSAAKVTGDPVWRMPLWAGYDGGLKSPIADMRNLGDGPMGGSITAALFLKRFVDAPSWVHFDIWAWRQSRYGRPPGAAACGMRAVWGMLRSRYA